MAVGPTLVVLVAVPFAATTVPPPSTSTLAFALLSKHVLYKREKKRKEEEKGKQLQRKYRKERNMQVKVFTLPAQCSEQMEEGVNLFLRSHKMMMKK